MEINVNTADDHYMDLMHNYYIVVPISKQYEEDLYEYKIFEDGEIRSCFIKMVFDEKKYNYIEKRLFDFINAKFGLYICMYEEEYIEYEQLKDVKELTENLIKNSGEEEFLQFANEFLKLINFAITHEVPVGLLF